MTGRPHASVHGLLGLRHLENLQLHAHELRHPDHPYLQNPCPAPQGTSTEAVGVPLAISALEQILPS